MSDTALGRLPRNVQHALDDLGRRPFSDGLRRHTGVNQFVQRTRRCKRADSTGIAALNVPHFRGHLLFQSHEFSLRGIAPGVQQIDHLSTHFIPEIRQAAEQIDRGDRLKCGDMMRAEFRVIAFLGRENRCDSKSPPAVSMQLVYVDNSHMHKLNPLKTRSNDRLTH